MRAAPLLMVLTGAALPACQLVFELDDNKLQFRRVMSADSDAIDTLSFERPEDVDDSDLLIAVIHSPDMDETIVTSKPNELEKLAEGEAKQCNDDWHTTFFAGIAGPATSYEFAFNMPESHYGLIAVYAKASRASLLVHRDPDELVASPVLPATMGAPESKLWLGGAATEVWTDPETPPGMTKRGSNRTIAMFEQPLVDGVVPEITLALPVDFCAGVAQIVIEPL